MALWIMFDMLSILFGSILHEIVRTCPYVVNKNRIMWCGVIKSENLSFLPIRLTTTAAQKPFVVIEFVLCGMQEMDTRQSSSYIAEDLTMCVSGNCFQQTQIHMLYVSFLYVWIGR